VVSACCEILKKNSALQQYTPEIIEKKHGKIKSRKNIAGEPPLKKVYVLH
jgi:hypothetical protein